MRSRPPSEARVVGRLPSPAPVLFTAATAPVTPPQHISQDRLHCGFLEVARRNACVHEHEDMGNGLWVQGRRTAGPEAGPELVRRFLPAVCSRLPWVQAYGGHEMIRVR